MNLLEASKLEVLARNAELEKQLASERARADRNRDETLSTIKDLAEAEQRAARFEELLQRALDTFVPNHDTANALAIKIGLGDLPNADLVTEIRQAIRLNLESETDDG